MGSILILFPKGENYEPHQYIKTKRNNQTTSTKCQYQAAASNPKWWCLVNWWFINLNKQTSKNVLPINTCAPWAPVVIKKVEPYTESEIVKGASKYSIACKAVNIKPSVTVKAKLIIASFLLPLIIPWWAQVTVAPELTKTAVFNNGIEKGSKGSIPLGGQTAPISIVGTKLLWKKAQKKEKNKQTSDTINKSIPYFSPCLTISVWWPW